MNTGRGRGRVTDCTLLECSQAIQSLKCFFSVCLFFCLGPLIIYHLGGGGVGYRVWAFFFLVRMKFIRPPTHILCWRKFIQPPFPQNAEKSLFSEKYPFPIDDILILLALLFPFLYILFKQGFSLLS